MKLKINSACDLSSIALLPPRRAGEISGEGRTSAPAAYASAAAGHRFQALPQQQPFSLNTGGRGGGMPSQSQLLEASLGQTLLSQQLPAPAHDQIFGLHNVSSQIPSFPPNSASCVQEESQQQLAKISNNTIPWRNPCLAESRCQVANEDAEHRFQQLANSVCRIEMVLDSVQNDVIQLNRSMKEASLDSDSIQRKVVLLDNSLQKILMVQDGEAGSIQQNDVLLDNSLQQILKGQDGLKELLEGGTKGNPDQLSVLNSHTSTLSEISSILSVWQEEIRADLRQLHGDIFRIFTKEMKGVVRAIRSLNSRPAALQMLEDRSCYPNERTWSSQVQVADGSPLMNQIPLANERLKMNQTPVSIGEPLMNLAVVANGSPLINQSPVANGRSQMNQTPVANGRPQMDRTPVANGRPHMEQITTNLFPARSSCSTKAADPKPNIEQGDVKATTPKLFGSSYMLAPKQGEVLNRKVNQQEPTKKAPVTIMIDSDDDSEGHASWVILNTEPADLMKEASREEGMQLLWSARKRSRRKRETRCIDATALPDVMRGKKRMGKAAPEAQEEEAVHVEAIPAKRTCRPNPKYDAEQWTA